MFQINKFADKVIQDAQLNLGLTRTVNGRRRRSVASGRLKDSLDWQHKGSTIDFIGEDYGIFIEEGRQPNSQQPPVDPIIEWIRVKNVKPRDRNGQFVPATTERIRSMAFNIARSIGRRGIPATKFLSEAIEKNIPLLEDEISEQIVNKFFEDLKGGNLLIKGV